ncbi:MAG: pantoate kinase [Desulfurococcaceae archaeon]
MALRVYVPLHISGVWIPHYSENPLEAGSTGAGLAVTSLLVAEEVSECGIFLNGLRVLVDQARELCSELGVERGVSARSWFSLGAGFGVSAALLVSHSLVLHSALRLPLLRALQRAHVLEVKYRTGLGDVIAEYTGGFVVRVKPGAPGVGVALRVPVKSRVDLVLVEVGAGESTSSMLSRMSRELLAEGERLLERVLDAQDLLVFFESARMFTSRLFNYGPAERALRGLRGVVDYYLKKSALVAWCERDHTWDVVSELEKRGFKARYSTISPMGVHVVDTP